ncbi:flagellar hook-associated protein FlgL [uncultured Clostridium sp.]|uniref:flagellin N-terminal helical domain-containing protein n=1 Tax=uncultured Clostridium sp. TaxID=59620 RepID=UPI000821AEFA|nr:flagellin [uncultured Clostridium sp.]SCJ98129.1 flagellar hook-associated protein FlgL [uncultured Clostridium sp.]
MRVTNRAMTNTYLSDVQKSLQSINKLNTQLNSGKQINKISDNPYEAIKILNMQNEINDVERYNYNCDEITGWLDSTDDALDKIGSISSEIKVLLTSISGAYGEDEIKAIRSEINEKVKQIGEALNTTYAGRFIFGGSNTDEAPVEIFENADGIVELKLKPGANKDKLKAEISDGIGIDYNLTASQVTDNLKGLNTINDVLSELGNDPIDKEKIQELNSELGNYMNHVLNNRSAIGARSNTVSNVKSSNDENILRLKGAYSDMQDVDWAEKYIELTSAQMIYNSSMQVGAKMIQPTLLDYLR